MPKMVSGVEAKEKALAAAHKLPEGAADKLTALKNGWGEASDAIKAGNLADALTKATALKGQVTELATSIGMK
jgi:hypothetical protein